MFSMVMSRCMFLSNIMDAIDAHEIPLHLAVHMTDERMHEEWDRCEDPRVLHEMLVRTHPKEAMLPLAREIATGTGVPLIYLETVNDIVEGSHRWRSYVNTRIRDTLEQQGSGVINKLLSWDELPLAWMEREGLLREGVINGQRLLSILRAAGAPTLADAVRAAEGYR